MFLSGFLSLPALADVGSAFQGVASLLAGYLGGILIFGLVIIGYLYIAAMDDPGESVRIKKAIGYLVAGGILVTVAATFGPELVTAFQK